MSTDISLTEDVDVVAEAEKILRNEARVQDLETTQTLRQLLGGNRKAIGLVIDLLDARIGQVCDVNFTKFIDLPIAQMLAAIDATLIVTQEHKVQ